MIFSTLLLIQTAAAPLPKPLTETHMRDIGCVATLGLVADEQRRGVATSLRFPNVMQRGRSYAGIVGERVMAETGQPREVVRLAMGQAVEDQQMQLAEAEKRGEEGKPILDALVAKCLPLLDAEVPEKVPTEDELRFCAAIISLSAEEIEGREGENSVNAKAMRNLADILTRKYAAAAYPDDPNRSMGPSLRRAEGEVSLEKARQAELARKGGELKALSEAEGEEKYQRCIFLGE